jgi:uncharacterized protein (DUF983 family)
MPFHEPEIWRPVRTVDNADKRLLTAAGLLAPTWTQALSRGVAGRCPTCGRSHLFDGYLSVVPLCPSCGEALAELPSDDVPPWVTMFIALHVLVGVVVLLGRTTNLGTGATVAIVLPLAVMLCLALLRPVKGFVVAVLVKLGSHIEDQEPA